MVAEETVVVAEEEVEAVVEPTEEEIFKANAMTPQEAAKELGGPEKGFSGRRIRRDIRSGVCPSRKIGGRWYCSVEHLTQYLSNLEAKAALKATRAAEAVKAAEEAPAPEAPEAPAPCISRHPSRDRGTPTQKQCWRSHSKPVLTLSGNRPAA